MIQPSLISLFPNNVIKMTGNTGTFAFESKEAIVSIWEYDRNNDIPFEEQNKQCFFLITGKKSLKY